MVESIAVPLSTLPHTAVRQLANVPGADSCRVNKELIVKSTL